MFDARPRLNAAANAAKGGGTEAIGNYPGAALEFLDIDNIHVVRDALSSLRGAILRRARAVLHGQLEADAEEATGGGHLEGSASIGMASPLAALSPEGRAAALRSSSLHPPSPFRGRDIASSHALAMAELMGTPRTEGGEEGGLGSYDVGSGEGLGRRVSITLEDEDEEQGGTSDGGLPTSPPLSPPALLSPSSSSPVEGSILSARSPAADGIARRDRIRAMRGHLGGGGDSTGEAPPLPPAPKLSLPASASAPALHPLESSTASLAATRVASVSHMPRSSHAHAGHTRASAGGKVSKRRDSVVGTWLSATKAMTKALLFRGDKGGKVGQPAPTRWEQVEVYDEGESPMGGARGSHEAAQESEAALDLVRGPSSSLPWIKLASIQLRGGVKVARRLLAGSSVLVHCSDGWDRTSALTALAQLMIDPAARSLFGFAVLIEKEWVSFGHRFGRRCGTGGVGHDRADAGDGQRAPIFLQFLDCVWQMLRQAPDAFEFNEGLLVALAEHAYSGRFGTFLFDCERDRAKAQLREKAASIWSVLLAPAVRGAFTNPRYSGRGGEGAQSAPPFALYAVLPDADPAALAVWPFWTLKWT
jgi:hypothetical protein